MTAWRFSGMSRRGYEFRTVIPELDTPTTMRAVASMLADAATVTRVERTENGTLWHDLGDRDA